MEPFITGDLDIESLGLPPFAEVVLAALVSDTTTDTDGTTVVIEPPPPTRPEVEPPEPEPPPGNTAPDAVDDAFATEAGQALTLDVLANDTDADGDTLTVDSVSDPPNGTPHSTRTAVSPTRRTRSSPAPTRSPTR